MATGDAPGDPSTAPITDLLRAWQAGDRRALEPLMERLYARLRAMARRRLRAERPDHSLRPTEIVHEAFLRLVDAKVAWRDRAHFLALAATTMRRVLVDHARSKQRQKRGGGALRVTLSEEQAIAEPPAVDLIALDQGLAKLGRMDAQQARLVELCAFGGLTVAEAAATVGLPRATAHRRLTLARAWLKRWLAARDPQGTVALQAEVSPDSKPSAKSTGTRS